MTSEVGPHSFAVSHTIPNNGCAGTSQGDVSKVVTLINGIPIADNCDSRHDSQRPVEESDVHVELRRTSRRNELRHAQSEVLPSEGKRRSTSALEAKEHAYCRLEQELQIAQTELKLKDEECEKLSKVRDQMGEELEELTASLFEEANNMVQVANVKRMKTEKLLTEANEKIEVLEAEVIALKQLVLTSTPSAPNKHLHPQIEANEKATPQPDKKKSSKPFWKTHRRSTSHHEFTKEERLKAEAQQQSPDKCKEIDPCCFEEFCEWKKLPEMSKSCAFLARIYFEDIDPCLNFTNKKLAQRVQECVENNTLTIEPIPGDSSYPRKCTLTESNKLCNYKIKLGEDTEWYSVSQHCRNRIASVCNFYTYIRYIYQGLVKGEEKDVFYEVVRLRKQIALSRLGYD